MGMENRGIALFDGADHLQIGIVFGPEQYAPRPQKYEDANSTHGNLMLDLYRDPTKVISVLDTKVEAPAEAAIPSNGTSVWVEPTRMDMWMPTP